MGENLDDFSITEEHARLGAVMGIVTYADDDTLNLFTEFGVSQEAEINFDLANKKDGDLRKVMCRCDPQNAEAPRRCGLHARSCLRGR